jgi:hypothetical protein
MLCTGGPGGSGTFGFAHSGEVDPCSHVDGGGGGGSIRVGVGSSIGGGGGGGVSTGGVSTGGVSTGGVSKLPVLPQAFSAHIHIPLC